MDNDYFVIMQYINREIEILKLIRDCITEKMLCIQEEMKVDKKADKKGRKKYGSPISWKFKEYD